MDQQTLEKVREIFATPASEEPSPPEVPEPEVPDATTLEALRPDGETAQDDDARITEDDLERLSSLLDFDRDALSLKEGRIRVRTKVDGDTFDKPLREIVKGYQLEEHTTRKSQNLARQQQEWEENKRKQEAELMERAQIGEHILTAQRKDLEKQYQEIPWDKLRKDDPAQYAAYQADWQRAFQSHDERQRQVQEELQTLRRKQVEEYQERLLRTRAEEMERLQSALRWSRDDVKAKGKQVSDYLVSNSGYTEDEIGHIVDHRFVVLAEKARQWDDLQKRVKNLKTKKETPKVPAGTPTAPGAAAPTRKIDHLIEKAKRTGRQPDRTAAAVAILRQSR